MKRGSQFGFIRLVGWSLVATQQFASWDPVQTFVKHSTFNQLPYASLFPPLIIDFFSASTLSPLSHALFAAPGVLVNHLNTSARRSTQWRSESSPAPSCCVGQYFEVFGGASDVAVPASSLCTLCGSARQPYGTLDEYTYTQARFRSCFLSRVSVKVRFHVSFNLDCWKYR